MARVIVAETGLSETALYTGIEPQHRTKLDIKAFGVRILYVLKAHWQFIA